MNFDDEEVSLHTFRFALPARTAQFTDNWPLSIRMCFCSLIEHHRYIFFCRSFTDVVSAVFAIVAMAHHVNCTATATQRSINTFALSTHTHTHGGNYLYMTKISCLHSNLSFTYHFPFERSWQNCMRRCFALPSSSSFRAQIIIICVFVVCSLFDCCFQSSVQASSFVCGVYMRAHEPSRKD